MSTPQEQAPGPAGLEQAVKDRIAQRTAGRVRDLEVSLVAGRIEVRGRTTSFHLKQLAIHGALEEIDSWGTGRQVKIDVLIAVTPASSDAEAELIGRQ
jgi:hypothetical protein